jgi:hypothetical protein
MSRQQYSFTTHKLDSCPAFPQGITAKRAIVSTGVEANGSDTYDFPCLVDTGADYCTFPADLLPLLGLKFSDLPTAPVCAVFGFEDMGFAWVDVTVSGFEKRRVYAGFSKNLNGKCSGLLGREGLLEQFKITFNHAKDVFELEN